ncbi:MAG: hypothetical protein ABWX73_11750 [Marmoricola sp.]
MSETSEHEPGGRFGGPLGGWPARLAVELVIGLALAATLLLVAWASSSAIKFVYGGY